MLISIGTAESRVLIPAAAKAGKGQHAFAPTTEVIPVTDL
jgi:hypothetical protein